MSNTTLTLDQLRNPALAPNTLAGYAANQKLFAVWCAERGHSAIPATTEAVELHLVYLMEQGRRSSTLNQRICSINHQHLAAGFASPCSEKIWAIPRMLRRLACEQPQGKTPILLSDLRVLVGATPGRDPLAVRDRAILLVGWASALRRCNLVALRIEDVRRDPQGVVLRIRREKQDRVGKGRDVAVPRFSDPALCPVSALDAWLTLRPSASGFLFTRVHVGHVSEHGLLPCAIARAVKRAAGRAGIPKHGLSAHSLRAGFATEALSQNVNQISVANQLGHASLASTRRYFRPADPFRGNACGALGL